MGQGRGLDKQEEIHDADQKVAHNELGAAEFHLVSQLCVDRLSHEVETDSDFSRSMKHEGDHGNEAEKVKDDHNYDEHRGQRFELTQSREDLTEQKLSHSQAKDELDFKKAHIQFGDRETDGKHKSQVRDRCIHQRLIKPCNLLYKVSLLLCFDLPWAHVQV